MPYFSAKQNSCVHTKVEGVLPQTLLPPFIKFHGNPSSSFYIIPFVISVNQPTTWSDRSGNITPSVEIITSPASLEYKQHHNIMFYAFTLCF